MLLVDNTSTKLVKPFGGKSGLGGRFPVGYPVGVVNKVEHRSGGPFSTVTAIPSALLDRSRHVLLVFTEDKLASGHKEVLNGHGG